MAAMVAVGFMPLEVGQMLPSKTNKFGTSWERPQGSTTEVAGSVPIAAQSLLEQISETARQNGIDVIWYRYHGNPVALLKFQANQPHPTIQFVDLQLDTGKLIITGRAIDAGTISSILGPVQPTSIGCL